jgi:hypothetical protein
MGLACMNLTKVFGRKKGRRYPVKRDEAGKSARQRCFEMFEDRLPAPEIAEATGVTIGTVNKYHQQWKKQPELEKQHAYFRELLKKKAPAHERNIDLVARLCGVPREELETMLQKPHGLKRMMMGKFYRPVQAEADHKRHRALEMAMLISDHLVKGGKFEDVYYAFAHLMKENQRRREEEDKDIEEENKDIELMRRVLEADVENERRGGIQADRLSDQERDTILRWGVQKAKREAEVAYWLRIAALMAGGITMEQARERIHQDLIDKGDVAGAKMVREYQDVIAPLKAHGQPSPPPPGQPPPQTP